MIFPFRVAARYFLLLGLVPAFFCAGSIVKSDPDPVQSVLKEADGILCKTPSGSLRLTVWGPDVIRVTDIRGSAAVNPSSLAVVGVPVATPWRLVKTDGYVAVVTAKMQARVSMAYGSVAFLTLAGAPILGEQPGGGRVLTPVVLPGPKPVNAYATSDEFMTSTDEDFYGLGEHQTHKGAGDSSHLNYTGASVRLEQNYIDNLDIPLMVSSKGYGLFWDNPASTDVNFGSVADVPASELYTADGKPGGLTGQYFNGENFDTLVGTRVDPTIDFTWTTSPPLTLGRDRYSVRWTGFIMMDHTGDYSLTTASDDGARMWVDGKQVIDDWNVHPLAIDHAMVHLTAGKRYAIKLEYYQESFDAVIKLQCARAGGSVSWKSEAGNSIDYFVFYGPSIDKVIAGYRTVTGQVPMPPLWGLGYWQSKERYSTQQEWLDIAGTYRQKQEPIDNIVQDWYYWDPYPWGSHVMNPSRYPDPAAAIKTLHDTDHMHIMISVWGKLSPGNSTGPDPNYDALNAKGFLYPDAVRGPDRFYDAFSPDARAMYWGFMRDDLFNKGFDAWWLDASEPEANLRALRSVQTGAGLGALVLNEWPLMHTTSVYQGQRQAAPNQRVFILTRSAFAGEQRNATTVWSSDITAGWDVFAHQIVNALNMSLSSIPYWSSDTGGFFCPYPGGSGNPEYGELFTRWFQFSSFCSIFRVHGTNTSKEIWRFGPTYEPVLVKYDNLRYRLMPYLYSQAWQVTAHGASIMRALVFDFPGDKKARELADEYLFGPSLLVCPVPTQGATTRSVYLPGGVGWYDFWTGRRFAGGQTISAPAPIATIPLYVREGAIVPMGPFEQYTTEKQADPIELRVYEGANGSFNLYEDEGVNYNYEKGLKASIPITWYQSSHTLTIGTRSGSFPGMLTSRKFNVVFVQNGVGGGLDISTAGHAVTYKGMTVTVKAPA
jgi:alpha-D-xyloside xylohydrolase